MRTRISLEERDKNIQLAPLKLIGLNIKTAKKNKKKNEYQNIYSKSIHSLGHSSIQSPQSVHSSFLVVTATSFKSYTFSGQMSTQAPQAIQQSASTFVGIF